MTWTDLVSGSDSTLIPLTYPNLANFKKSKYRKKRTICCVPLLWIAIPFKEEEIKLQGISTLPGFLQRAQRCDGCSMGILQTMQ